MAKLPAAIKRRSQLEPQQHENIMPRALEAIINSLDPNVEKQLMKAKKRPLLTF